MNNPQKKIAVLLAAYNGTQWLLQQIDSILNQVNVNVTIFISVDESTDGTHEMCQALTKQYSNVFVLPAVGRMGSAAKNFFRLIRDVDLTIFDYVAFADQDDIWNIDKLSRSLIQLEHTQSDAYSSNITAFWENGQRQLINKAQSQVQYDYMFESAGPGCTFVLTKRFAIDLQKIVISQQNQIHDVALHDWFMYAFARSKGYKWHIDSQPTMLYRQHAHNVVGANVGIKSALVRWKKMRQGWLVSQAILIADILDYSNKHPIVWLKRFNCMDRIKLVFNSFTYRRRLREKMALALFFIICKKA